ncbi:hypothetical protein RE474_09600 [Methanolobus sediminis]|uniref:Uncharacterized protein n=1 Tax=Methanolobus sediminis TaxID=3072978 RepID=A0AA51YLB3_9EURY|nr:hypothetical protein [Methanolobus sediminis]WMW24343.1 hypothetical protein RE474_09600 [Methanolobus sediminis]
MASSLTRQAVLFVFIISTISGLSYYWNMGASNDLSIQGLEDSDGSLVVDMEGDSAVSSLVLGLVDIVLEFVSWMSLFSVVKAILYTLLPEVLYKPLNLFLLRPVGWIAALITTEWVLNKIRGTSEN